MKWSRGVLIATVMVLAAPLLQAEEPGFIIFGTNDFRLTSLNFLENRCVIFQPLMNPAWAKPDANSLEEILAPDIHQLAYTSRKKDEKGAPYFLLPGDCRRSRLWVLVPEANQAIGQVVASHVDDESAHLDSGMRLKLSWPEPAAKRIEKMEQTKRFTASLEQLTWRVLQAENVVGYGPSPIYGLQVHVENGLVKPVSALLREMALEGELEKAATNGARQILDLLAMQSLDDQWFVNLVSRVPDADRMSARVRIPETNASIEIPTAGSASDIRIVDNRSHVSLNLLQARILQVSMPRGCSIRARDGSSVVLARPEKGVIVLPASVDDICAVITASGRNCNCQSASRQIVELSVNSPEQLRGTGEKAQSYPRACLWDSKCAVWTTVTGSHHCTVRPLSCEAARGPRMDLAPPPGCLIDGTGALQCDLKDDASSTDDCVKLLGDQWRIVFPEVSGMPLCQSLSR